MNAEEFGVFIAVCRREKNMTQLELAQKLSVTDKAVSRWERGKGFPDISLLVPLSDALDISILELMRSEKMQERKENFSDNDIKTMMSDIADMESENQRKTRFAAWIANLAAALLAAFAVLYDRASIGGGLLFGCIIALTINWGFLFALHQKDHSQRKAYGIFMLLGLGISLLLLSFMGISSRVLLCGLFFLFCFIIYIIIR